jgi:hypothetical protein
VVVEAARKDIRGLYTTKIIRQVLLRADISPRIFMGISGQILKEFQKNSNKLGEFSIINNLSFPRRRESIYVKPEPLKRSIT